MEKPRLKSGIPVDATGGPTIDPTKNVLDLVEAAIRRQDDLRGISIEHLGADVSLLKDYFIKVIDAYDKRYEQRYEASQKALEAAFAAQKDAVNAAFIAQKEAISAALSAADRAVAKAEQSAEKRFEGFNEFRGQLGDQQRTLMPRTEAEARFNVLSEKMGILEGFRTEQLSKGAGAKEGWGLAVGAIGFILTILSIAAVVITVLTRFVR